MADVDWESGEGVFALCFGALAALGRRERGWTRGLEGGVKGK